MGSIMTRADARARQILHEFEDLGNPANVAGMARYGIRSARVLGIGLPAVRARAKALGRDHELAAALWETGVMEVRILAALVDEPSLVTEDQMEAWVREFDSWALCDGVCGMLFGRTRFAVRKARAWVRRRDEYVRRAGFVQMVALTVHDKAAPDRLFLSFLPLIERGASDGRNFVTKAVSWALRQIGKRNLALNAAAVQVCRGLVAREEPAARWVGRDALAELTSAKTLARLRTARSRPPAPARTRSRPRPSAGTRGRTRRS
jgi:3-methyladenine DNA glycosylase AlkD